MFEKFGDKESKQLNALYKKQESGQELTKDEKKHRDYLLDLWEQDQKSGNSKVGKILSRFKII